MLMMRNAAGLKTAVTCVLVAPPPAHLPAGVLGDGALHTAAPLQAYGAVPEVQRRAAQATGAGVSHVPHPCAEKGRR